MTIEIDDGVVASLVIGGIVTGIDGDRISILARDGTTYRVQSENITFTRKPPEGSPWIPQSPPAR